MTKDIFSNRLYFPHFAFSFPHAAAWGYHCSRRAYAVQPLRGCFLHFIFLFPTRRRGATIVQGGLTPFNPFGVAFCILFFFSPRGGVGLPLFKEGLRRSTPSGLLFAFYFSFPHAAAWGFIFLFPTRRRGATIVQGGLTPFNPFGVAFCILFFFSPRGGVGTTMQRNFPHSREPQRGSIAVTPRRRVGTTMQRIFLYTNNNRTYFFASFPQR